MQISFLTYFFTEILICIGLFYICVINRKTPLRYSSVAIFAVTLMTFLGIVTFYTTASTSQWAICTLQSCNFPSLYTAIYIFSSISGAFGLLAGSIALMSVIQRKAD